MKSLGGLLHHSMKRNQLLNRVEASQVILEANAWLARVLPGHRVHDARAISCHDDILYIDVLNAAAKAFIEDRSIACTETLVKRFPKLDIHRVVVRINRHLHES